MRRLSNCSYKISSFSLACAAAGLICGSSSLAMADVRDPQIDQARQCTQYFPANERMNGIPTHLLAAIASSESGRWNDTLGMVIPWPWTINAEGKGYYLNSKAEAIAKVRSLQAMGIRSIDVGCMQVNLKHHPTAFASLEQAFDPKYNVAYAARFLRTNYNDLNSWTKATAAYHSRTPIYGNRYLNQIEKAWTTIVSKLRMARASQVASNTDDAAMHEEDARQEREFSALQREFDARERSGGANLLDQLAPVRAGKSAGRALPRTSMKVIAVRDISHKDRALVIRPQISGDEPPATLTPDNGEALQEVAMSSPDMGLVQQFSVPSKRVTSNVHSANTDSGQGRSSGPRFVFVQ